MSLNVLVLESVGSCMDEDGTVYPMNTDNTPDTNCGVDWLDTTDEWQESLSEEDCGLLNDWLLENNLSTDDDKCSKCGKIPAKIEYNDKKYCTWYCAKKESK